MTATQKRFIQAILVELVEINGKFHYRYETKEGVTTSKKGYYYEGQAFAAAEKAIDYYWYVGH